ncbi:hypothetical protein M885DRAFT_539837 [Pelagophyceae sp. CCMP2097]|nr:hypothetical protein M885DRAFT_539837 [Pelagophyceae sp. CCMP2097]
MVVAWTAAWRRSSGFAKAKIPNALPSPEWALVPTLIAASVLWADWNYDLGASQNYIAGAPAAALRWTAAPPQPPLFVLLAAALAAGLAVAAGALRGRSHAAGAGVIPAGADAGGWDDGDDAAPHSTWAANPLLGRAALADDALSALAAALPWVPALRRRPAPPLLEEDGGHAKQRPPTRRRAADDALPNEVWEVVLRHLDAGDAARHAASCRAARVRCEAHDLWAYYLHRDFGALEASGARGGLAEFQPLAGARGGALPAVRRDAAPAGAGAPGRLAYSLYSLSWFDRCLANCNVDDVRACVGIHGAVYDVTHFARKHPGDTDTLLSFAGTDASQLFFDVGHSSTANRIMRSLPSYAPRGGQRKGAHHGVRRRFDLARQAAFLRAPHSCARCGSGAQAIRIFFDVHEQAWKGWWPCCGTVPAVDIPRR